MLYIESAGIGLQSREPARTGPQHNESKRGTRPVNVQSRKCAPALTNIEGTGASGGEPRQRRVYSLCWATLCVGALWGSVGSAWATDKAFTFDRGGLTKRPNGVPAKAVPVALVPKAAPFTIQPGRPHDPGLAEVSYPWRRRSKRGKRRAQEVARQALAWVASGPRLCLAAMLVLAMVMPGNIAIDDAKRIKRRPESDFWQLTHRWNKARSLSETLASVAPVDVEPVHDRPVPAAGPPDKRSTKYATLRVIDPLVLRAIFGVPDLEVKSPYGMRNFDGKHEMHRAADIAPAGKGDKRVPIGFTLPEGEGNSRVRVLWVGRARRSGPNCPIVGFRARGVTYAGFVAHAGEVYKKRGDFVDGDPLLLIGSEGRCTGANAHVQLKEVTGKLKRLIDKSLAGESLPDGLTPVYVKSAFFNNSSGPFINPLGLFAQMRSDRTGPGSLLAVVPEGGERVDRGARNP